MRLTSLIVLNKPEEKFQLRQAQIGFMGHLFSKERLHGDPAKIDAISTMLPPKDVHDLRRFLGLANYMAKFVPHLADLGESMRQLTMADAAWHWSTDCEESFQKVKKAIAENATLKYFNPPLKIGRASCRERV